MAAPCRRLCTAHDAAGRRPCAHRSSSEGPPPRCAAGSWQTWLLEAPLACWPIRCVCPEKGGGWCASARARIIRPQHPNGRLSRTNCHTPRHRPCPPSGRPRREYRLGRLGRSDQDRHDGRVRVTIAMLRKAFKTDCPCCGQLARGFAPELARRGKALFAPKTAPEGAPLALAAALRVIHTGQRKHTPRSESSTISALSRRQAARGRR